MIEKKTAILYINNMINSLSERSYSSSGDECPFLHKSDVINQISNIAKIIEKEPSPEIDARKIENENNKKEIIDDIKNVLEVIDGRLSRIEYIVNKSEESKSEH